MLRLATKEDKQHCLRMARAFHQDSPFSSVSFSEEKCSALFDSYIGSDKTSLIIILACDTDPFGMVIGLKTELPFSTETVCSELAWWIDTDKRGSRDSIMLIKAYEEWSRKVSSRLTQVSMLTESVDLDKFYKRSGYSLSEKSYIKET